MDKVKCNWCEEVSIVNYDSDKCPKCGEEGYLMDIEQDIGDVQRELARARQEHIRKEAPWIIGGLD